MNPNKLTVGTKLKGRMTGNIREIEGFAPATTTTLRQWKVNGGWFNFAQLEARFSLHNPKEKEAVA